MATDSPGFLDHLDPPLRQELLAVGVSRRYATGAYLFVEGERAERVYALLRGRVKITSTSASGRESVFNVLQGGELIGELSALDGDVRSASAVALEPVSAVVIPDRDFVEFLARHADATMHMLRTVTARLREADRRQAEFGAHQAPARVAARLLDLVEMHGRSDPSRGPDAVVIDAAITQDDLAGLAGVSREAVARVLAGLRRAGVITTTRRRITVLDVDKLRQRSP